MSLPKIMYPQFDIVIPSTNQKVKFRQFLVKEEKILLVAKTSADDTDILTAVKQVVQNCCVDEKFNVDEITVFDLEYVFLRLRAISVSNIVNLSFKDFEDEKVYDFTVDLDKVNIEMPKKALNKVAISEKTGLVLKYPSASIYSDKKFLESSPEDATIELIARCLDKIYEDDEIYDAKTFTKEELVDFVNNLDVKSFEKINEYLGSAPKLTHVIKYKNSLNHDRQIELSTLNDFFMLR